jgi:plasmid stabilization system protein ParE
MVHIVVWSPRAIDHFDAIAAYIAEDSESYAAFGSSVNTGKN